MTPPAHRFQWRPYLLDLAALALIVLAPFVILLSYHGYPYFTPEVLLILAAALVAAALLALLISLTAGFVRILVLAGLIALFIDMHVGLSPRWSSLVVMLMFLGVVAVLAALLWLLRENAATIVCVIFITLLALTLVRGRDRKSVV